MWKQADRLLLATGRQGGWWIWSLVLAALLVASAEILLPTALGRTLDALPGGGPRGTWAVAACATLIAVMVAGKVIGDIATDE